MLLKHHEIVARLFHAEITEVRDRVQRSSRQFTDVLLDTQLRQIKELVSRTSSFCIFTHNSLQEGQTRDNVAWAREEAVRKIAVARQGVDTQVRLTMRRRNCR